MSEKILCPDCGQPNEPGSDRCAGCNYPLTASSAGHTSAPETAAPPQDASSSLLPTGLPRPRRRPPRADQTSLTLWILFAVVCGAVVLYIGIKANVDRATAPVEGSTAQQQQHADQFLAALARDSTDIEARIGLANVYYDTGNWSDAAVHYRRAVAQDSSLIGPLVDLGVCYYNQGQTGEAERVFQLALARDPHHPIALFNLGIVAERHDRPEEALRYYHRCLESDPPEEMRQSLVEAMTRLQAKTGKKPPPLPDGR